MGNIKVKKIFGLLLLMVFTIVGCSNTTTEKEKDIDFQIVDAMTSIGGIDETFDKQKLNYEFTIDKGNSLVKEDSIEIVLTDWTNEKLIKSEITEKRFNEDSIVVKGYVIFDSKDLTKKDIVDNEPLIDGIKATTESNKEIYIQHH